MPTVFPSLFYRGITSVAKGIMLSYLLIINSLLTQLDSKAFLVMWLSNFAMKYKWELQ